MDVSPGHFDSDKGPGLPSDFRFWGKGQLGGLISPLGFAPVPTLLHTEYQTPSYSLLSGSIRSVNYSPLRN